jgi:PhnB protein
VSVALNAYLNFKGNAREALEFYHSVFGGDLAISTFAEFHAEVDPSENNLVMHGALTGDNGISFFASDTPSHLEYTPAAGFSLSLSGDDEDLLSSYFGQVADGGTVVMPLEKAPWGDKFGMAIDKFGISWLVNISAAS